MQGPTLYNIVGKLHECEHGHSLMMDGRFKYAANVGWPYQHVTFEIKSIYKSNEATATYECVNCLTVAKNVIDRSRSDGMGVKFTVAMKKYLNLKRGTLTGLPAEVSTAC